MTAPIPTTPRRAAAAPVTAPSPTTPRRGGGEVVVVGDVMDDLVVVQAAPLAVGADTAARMRWRPGGGAANQAAWLARLGVPVRLVARVGAADRERHAAELAAHGLRPCLAADPDRPTGRAVVLVAPEGERTMLTDRGANAALAPGDLPAAAIAAARRLVLSGYTLLHNGSRAAGEHALALALAAGVPVVVDPGSAGWLAAFGAERFLALTAGAGLLVPNRDEARVLTGRDEPAAALDALAARYGTVALKLGAGGALLARGGVRVRAAAPPLPAGGDVTGAGDAFLAGLVAAELAGADPAGMVRAGVDAAAVALGTPGGRPPA